MFAIFLLSVYSDFSTTFGPICGFDIPNKTSWREDDSRMSYYWKGGIIIEFLVS